jgi:DNA-binding NarL/FixJ family response regulator
MRVNDIYCHIICGKEANLKKEIGRSLHISEGTVKSHLIHIFSKLGVADRTAAVTVALERGLLRLEQ